MRAREHLKQTLNELKNGSVENELNAGVDKQTRQTTTSSPRILSSVRSESYVLYSAYIHVYTHCVSKNAPLGILSISLPNINRFSQFFHWHTHWTICNKMICVYSTTSCSIHSDFSDLKKYISQDSVAMLLRWAVVVVVVA